MTLTWEPPGNNDDGSTLSDLGGYRIYMGTESGHYGSPIDVGNTTAFVIDGLNEGETYYFSVTAYNTSLNESDLPEEYVYTVPAARIPIAAPTRTVVPPINSTEPTPTTAPADKSPDKGRKLNFTVADGPSDISAFEIKDKSMFITSIRSADGALIESDFGKYSRIYDAPGDYAGTGRAQAGVVGVNRRKELVWVARDVITGRETLRKTFGKSPATPFTGCDFDGDSRTDLAVVRRSRIFIRNSSNGATAVLRLPAHRRLIDLGCGDTVAGGAYEITLLMTSKAKTGRDRTNPPRYLVQLNSSGRIISRITAKRAVGLIIANVNPASEREQAGYYRRSRANANDLIFRDEGGKIFTFKAPDFSDISTVTLRNADGSLADALAMEKSSRISLLYLNRNAAVKTFDSSIISGSLVHSQSGHIR